MYMLTPLRQVIVWVCSCFTVSTHGATQLTA